MARQVGSILAAVGFALFAILIFFYKREELGVCKSSLPWAKSTETCDDSGVEPAALDKGKKSKKKELTGAKPQKMALSKELKDQATGITLPRNKKFQKSDLTCLGVGVRAKSLVVAKVNVYTVGLYVDARPARGALKKFAGADPAKLKKDASLFTVLGQPGGFTKYLHLVFARGVGAQKVVDAFTSVKGVDAKVLGRFSSMILDAIGNSVGKGDTISLGWEGKDKMVVIVREKVAGTVQDATLPKAVFDLYLGSSPVAPAAKAAFGEGVSAFLNS